MTSEVKKKTVSLGLIVVSVTLCCTIVNSFRGTRSMQLCLLGGDFSFAAQLQETWTFVFSRPHTIGKEVGVEIRAEIKWLWESLYCVWSGNCWILCSPLSGMPLEFSKSGRQWYWYLLKIFFTKYCIDFSGSMLSGSLLEILSLSLCLCPSPCSLSLSKKGGIFPVPFLSLLKKKKKKKQTSWKLENPQVLLCLSDRLSPSFLLCLAPSPLCRPATSKQP